MSEEWRKSLRLGPKGIGSTVRATMWHQRIVKWLDQDRIYGASLHGEVEVAAMDPQHCRNVVKKLYRERESLLRAARIRMLAAKPPGTPGSPEFSKFMEDYKKEHAMQSLGAARWLYSKPLMQALRARAFNKKDGEPTEG
jgi:hypothetical protein